MTIKKVVIKSSTPTRDFGIQTSHIYKGFNSNLKEQNFKTYDLECVRQDIINQFSTRKGERVMNPNQGTIIWDAIFEPLTPDLKVAIAEDIRGLLRAEPRVTVEAVKVDEYQSGILLEITVRYNTTNLAQVIKLNFDKELGLIAS
jgi:phage baseplate assembly protein W